MALLKQWLLDSAEEWRISPRIATSIFWLPIIGAVVIAAMILNRPLYRFVIREDGPVEYAQFVFFALASLYGALVGIKRLRAGHVWQGILFLLFALGMFFIAGEEIAWGQRILGLTTPEELEEVNKQGEITVHNIGNVLFFLNLVFMLIGAGGMVAWVANKKLQLQQYWDQANYLLVPPFFLAPAFFMAFAYKLVRFTVVRTPGFIVTKYGEWPELCMAFALCAFVWLNYRRLKVQQEGAIPKVSMSTQVIK